MGDDVSLSGIGEGGRYGAWDDGAWWYLVAVVVVIPLVEGASLLRVSDEPINSVVSAGGKKPFAVPVSACHKRERERKKNTRRRK
jgi:hypothetical protein